MEDRPSGRSDNETENNREPPPGRPSRDPPGEHGAGDDDGTFRPLRSPRTAADVTSDPTSARSARGPPAEGIRRRSTMATRRTTNLPSLARRTTLAQRTQGQFTLAGPDDTQQLQTANAPFVHPGYADLNPAYEQPRNAKPVWSLAKPLPRVVRPGMVPTKNELLENRIGAELPAENSQKAGLDVDPNELEKGRIDKSADLRKVAAQVEDARLQRENNFINTILNGGNAGTGTGCLSRTRSSQVRSSTRQTAAAPPSLLSAVPEAPSKASGSAEETQRSDGEEGSTHSVFDLDISNDEPIEGNRSVETLGLDEAVYPDDLEPLVQNVVEDEIHNNHTTWSVIRTHHREALAESLAVFVQLTIGFCSDIAVTVAKQGNPNTTDWAWGFATMIGIYVSGGISGAHLNPTITVMLWFYRGFPKRKMPEYFLAQFIGAFCAAFATYGVYYVSIQNYLATDPPTDIVNSFVTGQRSSFITAPTALFNEFMGTMMLTIAVLALGDDQNAPPGAGMNSFIIGLVICVLSMAFANQTGAALNPSRDFGPRLALLCLGYGSQLFTNPYWFYGPFAGSLLGSFMGAFLYDFMIFTGGESPINYPLERTRRSLYKSRMKWERRLHMIKPEMDNKDVLA